MEKLGKTKKKKKDEKLESGGKKISERGSDPFFSIRCIILMLFFLHIIYITICITYIPRTHRIPRIPHYVYKTFTLYCMLIILLKRTNSVLLHYVYREVYC